MARSSGRICNFEVETYVLICSLVTLTTSLARDEVYYDSYLIVTAEIRQRIANQGIILEVGGVVGHHLNCTSGAAELLMAFRELVGAP
ncbi:hypothetical protein PsorP6_010326 [Peronosclerospora sorghi]|uniref:Uncharacterized protein n=1 Tax=Peronosclerospora sorghi TaxID=230839 RepID=A0ACC0VVD0_9STRA|nr:hypothetical protein PsorP6_010326 [Peronosclerospora sorghi]